MNDALTKLMEGERELGRREENITVLKLVQKLSKEYEVEGHSVEYGSGYIQALHNISENL